MPSISTPLSTSGRYIVDANGHRVKLSGVNWAGAHQDKGVPAGLDILPLTTIASQIASWGFNCVRLPFSVSGVVGPFASTVPDNSLLAANTDLQGQTVWQIYQSVVSGLSSAGLMVIPNQHLLYQGWCCSLQDTNGLWWNANWTNQQYRNAWQAIAQAFASNPLVVGCDIHNEPRQSTISGVVYNPDWTNDYDNVDMCGNYGATGNLIHQYAPDMLIICEGLNSGSDLTGVKTHQVSLNMANKVVYSIHDYPSSYSTTESFASYQSDMANRASFVLSEGIAPLLIGEFGVANDSMSALGGSNPVSDGTGLGYGPVSQGNGNWMNNFVELWGPNGLDVDWCVWQLSGTHVEGTTPSTNQLQYNKGDRCWNGLYAQDWQEAANPAQIALLQSLMPKVLGP